MHRHLSSFWSSKGNDKQQKINVHELDRNEAGARSLLVMRLYRVVVILTS